MKTKKSLSIEYGFSLIEVMLAFLLLTIGIAGLIYSQTRNIRKARKASALIVASQLARKKLYDCKFTMLKEAFSLTGFSDRGDFSSEALPEYTWECSAPPFDIPPPNMDLIRQSLGGGAEQGSSNLMTQIMGTIYPMIVPAISNSARELVTIIRWKDGAENEEFRITTHVINQVQFAQAMAAFPNLGQLIQQATQPTPPPGGP